MAVFDVVAGGENGVQWVACGVHGVVDELKEASVDHVVEEGGGAGVFEVVEVKVEVPEENIVVGVYGEGGR